ncbi:MAG: FKBP-type peptidyl-prolyl cis-trans isomerase [Eubacterium sp.]|nr:FKBP-type peptidyl-prolyl cis-trans isomerase [Eubacterium sp.]
MKNKQVLAIIMAAVIAAGGALAGCGAEGGTSSGSGAAASSEASADASSADSDDAAAEESDDEDDAVPIDEDYDEEDEEESEYDAWLEGLPVSDGDAAVEDCIKLGEYKGLKLTKTVTKITDEAVETYARSNAEMTELTDADAAVESGDTVNIAYVGEKDGVAFDGGTSDSYDLEIGSGTFIDGFEDGVIGMKTGETKDLNLTFPEDYGSEELAGADVVFHVTVNTINRPEEITDADLEEARAGLEADYEDEAVAVLQTDAWQKVKDGSKFLQLRKADVDGYYAQMEEEYDEWIKSLDMTKEEYLEEQGVTEEQYEKDMLLYAKDMATEALLVEALANAEGLTADDQEQIDEIAVLAEDNDMTPDELIADAGEKTVYQYVMTKRLLDRIIEYADVTVETVESTDDMYDLEGYDFLDDADEGEDVEVYDEEDLDADYEEVDEDELEELVLSESDEK